MKNFLKRGNVINFTNNTGADIHSGDLVIIGSVAGFAETDIVEGDTGSVLLEGVFSTAKDANAIGQGAKCYWDAVNKVITATAQGNTYVGFAHYAALAADATVALQLVNGI